jgi:hypothetical protein
MSTVLKCPNPSCPYLFDPSRVPAGVVLTCPRCGMRFTLGPPAPAAPPPPTVPQTPPEAAFAGFKKDEPEPDAESQPRRRNYSAAGESSPLQTGLIAFICFVLLAGVGAMIYMRFAGDNVPVKGETGQQLRSLNLALELPGEPWAMDENVKAALGPPMVIAFKRADPDAFIAFGGRDYESREPRRSDLVAGINQVLDRSFSDVTQEPYTDWTFLGQPAAVGFKFTGRNKEGSPVAGLCYATSYKGIAYWCICWSGDRDAEGQSEAFESIRAKFKLDKHREAWKPKEQPVQVRGGHSLGYQLLDGEDIWKEPDAKERPPSGEDPHGDLLLVANVKEKGRDTRAEATLVAIVLDAAGGDVLAQGRKYVEEQRTALLKAADEKFTPVFNELKGPPVGDPASNPVETPTPVVRLQMTVQGSSSSSKLLVISALKIGDRVVVVHAYCAWNERELFEAKMEQIAGSLRESK